MAFFFLFPFDIFASLSERVHNNLSGFIHRGLPFSFFFSEVVFYGSVHCPGGNKSRHRTHWSWSKEPNDQKRERVSPAGVLLEVEYCPFSP